MLYELPLLSGSGSVGRAEYEEAGVRVRFRCRLHGSERLCKLYLARGGSRALLGTPAPAQGGLYLERTLSRSELERAGVWPPERVEVDFGGEQPPAVWQEVTAQQPRFAEPLLARLFRQGGWGWKRWERGVVLCHSWRADAPIPAMAVCCFLRLEPRQVCCWLDGEGRPCFPPERSG